MTTWRPIADDAGTVSIPRKGERVRIAEHFRAHLAALAGAQMKLGAERVPETAGTLLDVQGIGRERGARPDAVELTVALDDGTTRVVALPFTPDSLARVSVEVDDA